MSEDVGLVKVGSLMLLRGLCDATLLRRLTGIFLRDCWSIMGFFIFVDCMVNVVTSVVDRLK